MERVNVTGTISGRLRSSAPHVRSVRKDYMIRQRDVSDGVLKAHKTVNLCHCYSQVTNTSRQSNKSFACTRDSIPADVRILPDAISRLKSNLWQNS